MRTGLVLANVGAFADPRTVADVAVRAEAAGWEALFLWDHLAWVWDGPSVDPWVTLGAVGARTERLVLGTAVTPVPRRRPQVLAHELATLDALTGGGRVVLGAGLGGVEREFTEFGEDAGAKRRARLLDEGLRTIAELLAGPLGPRTIPVWIGGDSPAARRRAARHDGWIPNTSDPSGMTVTPEQLAARAREAGPLRDLVVTGYSEPGGASVRDAYADAGATWWLESLHDRRGPLDELRTRVEAGP